MLMTDYEVQKILVEKDVKWLVDSLKSDNEKLRNKIKILESQLDKSIQSTGNYMSFNGNIIKGVIETTNPDIVITTRKFIEEMIE